MSMTEFIETRVFTILLTLAIGLIALAFRIRSRSWSNPAVIFALFWFLLTFLPVVGVPELVASPLALAYILLAVFAFGLPVFMISWQPALVAAHSRRGRIDPIFSSSKFLAAYLILQSLPLLFMAANLRVQGISALTIFTDPLSIGCEYLGIRYSGAAIPNIYSKLGTVINYVGASLAGFIIANQRRYIYNAAVLTMAFLPSVLYVLIYADKGTIFLCLAFLYGSLVTARIMNGDTSLITWRTLLSAPAVLLVIAFAIVLGLVNRGDGSCQERTSQIVERMETIVTADSGSDTGSEVVEQSGEMSAKEHLLYNVRSYAFGHIFAFSDWFDHRFDPGEPSNVNVGPSKAYSDPEHITYGFWTFLAIGKHFDRNYYDSLPDGYFDEYFLAKNILQTNIYTMFRGLIYDYTLAGSIVFMFLFGLVINLSFKAMLLRIWSPVPQALYIVYAGYLYTSYIISLLIWNSAYSQGILIAIILYLCGHYNKQITTRLVPRETGA